MKPKITIVTPSFNQAEYLERTILSVLNQNYPNLEYIIIDGGSTDGSVEIIKRYADRLAYWVTEPDKGLYDAVQKGFEKSTGEIMAWINSDDEYFQGAFDVVAEIFENFNEIEWITGNTAYMDDRSRSTGTYSPKRYSRMGYFIGDYGFIQQESTFWRRSLWEKAGGKMNLDYKLAGDLELWNRFFQLSDLYAVNSIIAFFRGRSGEQKSLNCFDDYMIEAHNIIHKRFQNLSFTERIKVRRFQYLHFIYRRLGINIYFRWAFYKSYAFIIGFDRRTQKFVKSEEPSSVARLLNKFKRVIIKLIRQNKV